MMVAGRRVRWLVVLGLGWAAASCNGAGPGPSEPAPEGTAADASAAGVEVAAAPVEGEHYVVEARREDVVRVGEETRVVFVVSGREPWHVNPDYRAKLAAVVVEHFALAASEWRAGGPDREVGDAVRCDETELRFEVPVVPLDAGEWPVEFRFKFGLCDSVHAGECKVREKVLGWTWVVAGGEAG
ncbi:MAG: hypothetical protein HY907_17685 [Deltaproteobacteria bacterium]|nr:hypothetical protein [Deltaproteobacteria bacterium]